MYGSYEAVQPLDETSSSEDRSHHQVAQTFYQTHVSLIYACTVALAMAGISIFFFRKLVGLIRGVIYEQVRQKYPHYYELDKRAQFCNFVTHFHKTINYDIIVVFCGLRLARAKDNVFMHLSF